MGKQTDILLRESEAVLQSEVLLDVPVEQLTSAEAAIAWSFLDFVVKEVVDSRKKDLRQRLFGFVETSGKRTKSGSYVAEISGIGAKVEKRKRSGKVSILLDKVKEIFSGRSDILGMVIWHQIKVSKDIFMALGAILTWLRKEIDFSQRAQTISVPEFIRGDIARVFAAWPFNSIEYVDTDGLEVLVKENRVSLEELKAVTHVGSPTWALYVKKPQCVVKLLEKRRKDDSA
jgi:hypothetical protein